MSVVRRLTVAAVGVASLLSFAKPAQAVILNRTAVRNTAAPTNGLLNSGWQWEGNFGGFLGTPIAPNYFITAEHIGGGVGTPLVLNGKTYNTTAKYDDASTDLRIFKVSTPFTSWAPLYTGSAEVSKMMSVYGRGTQRGVTVTKNGVSKGWKWGTDDRKKSWGRNAVAGVTAGGTGRGDLLRFAFNKTGGDFYESALSTGDSSGGVFVKDTDGKWKLAGINYLVDGQFSLTGTNGSGFNASLYDKGGLYVGADSAWVYTADTAADVPGNFYATRISKRYTWIKSIIGTSASAAPLSLDSVGPLTVTGVPEPTGLSLIALGAVAWLRRRR